MRQRDPKPAAPKSKPTTTPEQRRVIESHGGSPAQEERVTRDEDREDELLQLRKIKFPDLEKLPGEK
jgi:hypothetical protein